MDIVKTNSDKTVLNCKFWEIGALNCNSLIVGSILGDAYLNKFGALTVEHSLKQKEYLHWKVSSTRILWFFSTLEHTKNSDPFKQKNKQKDPVFEVFYQIFV